jgi:hypothetical protein
VKLLLAAGADIHIQGRVSTEISAQELLTGLKKHARILLWLQFGKTALMIASEKPDTETYRRLKTAEEVQVGAVI